MKSSLLEHTFRQSWHYICSHSNNSHNSVDIIKAYLNCLIQELISSSVITSCSHTRIEVTHTLDNKGIYRSATTDIILYFLTEAEYHFTLSFNDYIEIKEPDPFIRWKLIIEELNDIEEDE